MIKERINPCFVKELSTGYVIMSDNQHFKRYTSSFAFVSRVNGNIENYGNNGKGPLCRYLIEKMCFDDNRLSKNELEKLSSVSI